MLSSSHCKDIRGELNMRHYVTVRGYKIAVHARTDAQLRWYQDNYATHSDLELASMADQTEQDGINKGLDLASKRRQEATLERRAKFYVVA